MNERTLARFLSKVNENGPLPPGKPELGPCWMWKPTPSTGGYGQFYLDGKMRLAHRASYEIFVGPIPDGLTIDHLCTVRACVRPQHLEAISLAENLRRAKAWENGAAAQRAKTHCAQGHPFAGDNLRIAGDGRRVCRACAREQMARRRERLRAESPIVAKPPREWCANGHSWAEFGVVRNGRQVCRQCERDKCRRSREKRKAEQGPKPERETCAHGHPWSEENVYVSPSGGKACRSCHNAKTLAAYYEQKAARPAKLPKPPRETCKNGHPWTPENLYVTPSGLEKCRECSRERNRRHEAKRKAARPPKPPRTHCKHGHELAGDNLYTGPDGRKFCRTCTAEYQRRRRDGEAVPNPNKGKPRGSKTHCPQGHPYEGDNLIVRADGGRKCRECQRERQRDYERRKRAGGKAA